jgi:hypothetical protein
MLKMMDTRSGKTILNRIYWNSTRTILDIDLSDFSSVKTSPVITIVDYIIKSRSESFCAKPRD